MNSLLQTTFIYTYFCQAVFIIDYSVVSRRVSSFLSSRTDFINVALFHYLLISFPGHSRCGFYYKYFSVFKRMVFSVSRGVGLVEHWKQTFAEEEKVICREGKGERGRGKGGREETVYPCVCVHLCVCALCMCPHVCACAPVCVHVSVRVYLCALCMCPRVCMCSCVCVHCVCAHVCVHVYLCVRTLCMCPHVCVHVCVRTVYVPCVCAHLCVSTCVCVCTVYVPMCACVCTCVHMCTMCPCVCVHLCACAPVCMWALCMRPRVCACAPVCVCAFVCGYAEGTMSKTSRNRHQEQPTLTDGNKTD